MPPSSLASASPLPEDDRIATLQPSCASRRAAAAPMPLPPAVTIATFIDCLRCDRIRHHSGEADQHVATPAEPGVFLRRAKSAAHIQAFTPVFDGPRRLP